MINQNGTLVICKNGKVYINEDEYEMPKGMNGNCQAIINGNIYIDGFEFDKKKKRFKRSFAALKELFFF